MRLCEWVAIGYFAYLFVVALITLPGSRRWVAAARSLAAMAVVLAPLALPDTRRLETLRDWLPAVHLLIGYWLSGLFFIAPMPAVEARFLAVDEWLYHAGLSTLVARTPRIALEALELAYLTCFVFVPGGMVLLYLAGRSDVADRFWTLVLACEFGSFGMLPWIQTRPPRDIEPPGVIDHRPIFLRRVNLAMVKRTSIGWNTFPSGHVAGSLAVAVAVSAAVPALTLPMGAAALLITVSTVVGRYHYAVDAVAGAALTAIVWTLLHLVS